jgi:aminopeptidase 2
MIALANGIEESIEYVNNNFEWKLTRFRSTPPMSSYLLALAIGHLSSHQVINRAGTLIRLWAWTGAEEYSDFGLKIAADTLDFMGTYFNSTFPLAKLGTFLVDIQ